MKHFRGFLLLSIALHAGAGWLLRELHTRPEPLAWQPPMSIQLVSLAPTTEAMPTAQPEPVRRPVAPVPPPKAIAPAKAEPAPSPPKAIVRPTAIAKASPVQPQARQPAPVRPATPSSAPAAVAQTNSASVPAATPVPTAASPAPVVAAPAPPATPVVSLRPAFVTPPPAPRYPNEARRRNQQGIVRVEVHLDERGQQLKCVLTRSSGIESLDQAALEAVTRWRFRPEIVDGRAVPSRVEIPIEFALTANR
ncbi:TonB family protein [Pseudomonas sp. NPDC089569]|uniref:energy transducer TonB n=1 Tax=Pseudomonas sp. NPDC089569 TaxID=3390722 RepID=UPI003D06DC58